MSQSVFDELFVLELANNHWGNLDRGLKIISDFARVVRFNNVRASIKLQFRDVESFIHAQYRDRDDVRYIKKTLDTQMPWESLRIMLEAVRSHGMLTTVTPFDERSVAKCVEYGVDILKIASADVRDKSLLRAMKATGKPVIASSGGASLAHVDALVAFFADHHAPFALNHCVSLYPSEDDELELNQIDFLRARYPGITIGLSTHEHRDWHDSIVIAYAKGARTFERHIDIDQDGVPVSPYCTRPEQADAWFKAFRRARAMCGGPGSAKRAIPERETRYLDALVRGVYLRRDLPAGHVLTDADVYMAVPLLHGQVSSREFSQGEVLLRPLGADAPLQLDAAGADYARDPALIEIVRDRGLAPARPAMLERPRLAS